MSYIKIAPESPFSIRNIPFGVFSTRSDPQRRIGTAVGEYVLDLSALARAHVFSDNLKERFDESTLLQTTLNSFAALGRPVTRSVRAFIQDLLREETRLPHVLRDNQNLRQSSFVALVDAEMHLPFTIGDYTDFFAGIEHATRAGTIFRGKENALNPNYTHFPVGYHGRASSIVPSGVPIKRPVGQGLDANGNPEVRPSKRLDVELELAAFVGKGNKMGEAIKIDDAMDHLFGVVVMNDWSARDIQQWEAIPLGPFNGKNFGTTISPWVVTFDALEPFMTDLMPRVSSIVLSLNLIPFADTLLEKSNSPVYHTQGSQDWHRHCPRNSHET
jgi:fumarylacetoacetase